MNFFRAQDAARRNTTRLVVLFSVAVVALIVLTNLLIAATVIWFGGSTQELSAAESLRMLPDAYWLWIAVGVTGVVALASLYKYVALSGGGRNVAERLGGHLATRDTDQPQVRRLLNVVEEMAIASGIGVPPVYLLEERGINAFAAGFSPDDAVIGVTRGAVDTLNRDQLQAVIGHEFSHILNGDTRLNLRLMAVLHGILFLGIVGYALLRGGSRGGKNAVPLLVLAGGLIAIGFVGTFCGGLIKAGVSRQREFLADAASVQFTRNPFGMAGALKMIGATSSRIESPRASEASHMFFGQAVRNIAGRLSATHPPLPDRIRAIEPNWDGAYPHAPLVAPATPQTAGGMTTAASAEVAAAAFAGVVDHVAGAADAAAGIAGAEPLDEAGAVAGPAGVPGKLDETNWSTTGAVHTAIAAADVEDAVGHPSDEQLSLARALIDSTDQLALDAAHDPWGARALLYAMVLSSDPALRVRQLDFVIDNADKGVPQFLQRLIEPVAGHDLLHRLTLVELAIPALKTLSTPQYRRFRMILESLIKLDRQIDLAEWVLHRLVLKELAPHFDGPKRVRASLNDVTEAPEACVVVLSSLARHSSPDPLQQREALDAGLNALGLSTFHDCRSHTGDNDHSFDRDAHSARDTVNGNGEIADDPNFVALNRSLRTLRTLKPLAKPKLLKACAATVAADEHVCPDEAALLQGIAAALDCPLPPLVKAG